MIAKFEVAKFDDIQNYSQQTMDAFMKTMGEWNKGMQAIAAEMTDFTKRSMEDSKSAMEQLMAVKSVEQAVEIQTGFAKQAYETFVAQWTKVGGMYANMAKDAYKPIERAITSRRV